MSLKWTAPARRDIQDLPDYYSRIDRNLAERMEHAVEVEPLRLLDHPYMGAQTVAAEVRKWRVRGTPYQLYYRVTGRDIVILHVARDAFWR
ncbi:type II toxin-antitoxin system RelE/ParE family toxin [Sphingomonas segetis]|uniref:type II toxin-antitoxin system RelE/ParE family toxin n=1 Tax=Sphingomonas segetis TaxID=1104779 RepID=UPI0012D2F6E5|nr:type II toxin-antitoxin system RelE/ParE family toxin [Sphingomonas segetis]